MNDGNRTGQTEEEVYKSGFATIYGSPNVGKSTLMNALLGQKVAIVSAKAQTTRTRIRGVLSLPKAQIILIDTPGVQAPKNRLGEYMAKAGAQALRDVECILYVADPTAGIRERDESILQQIKKQNTAVIAVINKVDIASAEQLAAARERLAQEEWLADVLECSAATGRGLTKLIDRLLDYMPEGPQYFPEDMVTDQPERVLCAEFIREACLQNLDQEIPHGIAVEIEKISLREDRELYDIWAVIYCERESHKRILIGKKGSMLKKIGGAARKQVEWLMDARVNLQLWVKVRDRWRESNTALQDLGYREES